MSNAIVNAEKKKENCAVFITKHQSPKGCQPSEFADTILLFIISDCSGQIVKRVRAFAFKRLQISHAFQERRLKNAPVNEKTEPLALTVGKLNFYYKKRNSNNSRAF